MVLIVEVTSRALIHRTNGVRDVHGVAVGGGVVCVVWTCDALHDACKIVGGKRVEIVES